MAPDWGWRSRRTSLALAEDTVGTHLGWGLALTARPGCYAERWSAALDLAWHTVPATYIAHSDAVRDLFEDRYSSGHGGHPDGPRDGWYAMGANRLRAGVAGGARLGKAGSVFLTGGLEYTPQSQGIIGYPPSPALFVVHGSLSDHRALRPFAALAERYFVVMWDQRGNGLSERLTEEEYTWDSVVEEIDTLKALFSPDRPVTFVGHSFGAMYTSLYISSRPENVRQAVLMEPGGLNGGIFEDTYADIINIDVFDAGLEQMFWQNEVLSPSDHEVMDHRALMILLNGHQSNYYCDPEAPPHLPVWRSGAHVEYLRGLRMMGDSGFDFDFASGAGAFPTKVLFVAGECSALGPEYQRRYHVPLFQDAEVVSVPNAGHRLFVEQFDTVLSAVKEYLDEYRPDCPHPACVSARAQGTGTA